MRVGPSSRKWAGSARATWVDRSRAIGTRSSQNDYARKQPWQSATDWHSMPRAFFSPSRVAQVGPSLRGRCPARHAALSLCASPVSASGLSFETVKLKYAGKHPECVDQPCPCPKKYPLSPSGTAYRFVNAQVQADDFRPAVEHEIPRIGDDRIIAQPRECIHLALSFFESLQSAQRKWRALNERVDAAARLGTHIAQLDLVGTDGIVSKPDRTGHFGLHEAESTEFISRITGLHAA